MSRTQVRTVRYLICLHSANFLTSLPYQIRLHGPMEEAACQTSPIGGTGVQRSALRIQQYEIGEKPVRPDSIEASYSGGVLTVNITENGKTLTLTSQVILPAGTGPFPAVIGLGGFSEWKYPFQHL